MTKEIKKPPIFGRWLLNRMSRYDSEFSCNGDFEEEYREIQITEGRFRANSWFWHQVLFSMWAYLKAAIYWSAVMFKNYMKIMFRNFIRQKTYSVINVTGLAAGMACSILIFAFVFYELSYDKYHANADRIYRVCMQLKLKGKGNPVPCTGPPLGPVLVREYPEVIDAVRFLPAEKISVRYNDVKFYETKAFYADNSVFDIFSFKMIEGDPENALEASNTIVLTESAAKRYFGSNDPLGKVLKFREYENYTVTGIMEDIPENSHFTFDMLCSYKTLYSTRGYEQMESWKTAWDYYTYVLLSETANHRDLENKLGAIVSKYMKENTGSGEAEIHITLQPLKSIHLHSNMGYEISGNSSIAYVYILTTIAVFILLISCINFMNLSTARSSVRAKEIGIRKAMGSDREELIRQFLFESFLYSFLSLVIAVFFVKLALPVFSNISGAELSIGYSDIPLLLPVLILFALLVGLTAGSYPAFFLSAFQPASVLKGRIRTGLRNSGFRNVLVIFQFAISIILLTGTGIIMNQLEFMKSTRLGFDKEHIVVIPISSVQVIRSLESIKEELKGRENILNASASLQVPGETPSSFYFHPEGFPEDQHILMNEINVDFDFIPEMGIEVVMGRNFSSEFQTDRRDAILINETAAGEIGWEDPIGKTISGHRTKKVIGVVKDFHFRSLHKKINPLIINHIPGWYRSLSVKIKPDDIPETLAVIRNVWQKFVPNSPFEYSFLDSSFDNQYKADEKLSRIFKYFSFFAVFIACLGLLGMASFTAEQRTKEIGIRKVLGATTLKILLLLNKETMRSMLIANLISWPLIYFAASKWLNTFAYRTGISILLFALSALAVLLIGFFTVSFQSVKAAAANPVDSLRDE